MNISAYDVALRFLGMKEAPGLASNPQILAMLKLDNEWASGDDVAWCGAFVSYVCWILGMPRSVKLSARSWLNVGVPIELADAKQGDDIVIFKRGTDPQPGPEVIDAPGHVAFFSAYMDTPQGSLVRVLGGNQSDAVTLGYWPANKVLGVRRLA